MPGSGRERLAAIVRRVREVAGLSRSKFTARVTAELGLAVRLSDVTLGSIEKGKGSPSMETLAKIGFYIPDPENVGSWLDEIDLYLIWKDEGSFWPDGWELTADFETQAKLLSNRLEIRHKDFAAEVLGKKEPIEIQGVGSLIQANMEARGMGLEQFSALVGLSPKAIQELLDPRTPSAQASKLRLSLLAPFLLNPKTGKPFADAIELIEATSA